MNALMTTAFRVFFIIANSAFLSLGYVPLQPELLFKDTFEASAPSDDINAGNAARQSGNVAPLDYSQKNNPAQLGQPDAVGRVRLASNAYISPNHNFTEGGKFTIEFDVDPGINDDPSDGLSTDWCAVIFGATSQNLFVTGSDGMGILFRNNGDIEVWDGASRAYSGNGEVTGGIPVDKSFHVRLEVDAPDFNGRAATIRMFINDKQARIDDNTLEHVKPAGFHGNYITLEGLGFPGPWVHTFDNLSVRAVPSFGTCTETKLTASDGAAADLFGFSVAISADGNTIVAGMATVLSRAGAAYIYVRSGTTWTEQAKLTPSDGAPGDEFGWSVAISGETVVVGAIFSDAAGSDSGAAYVYVRSGTTWTQQAKLVASDAAPIDDFGRSVSIEGDTLLVGAPSTFNFVSGPGRAYVFTRSGTTWTEQQKLTASDGADGDTFGRSVALSGDTAVVGAARNYNTGGFYAGAAYVYVRTGASWNEQAKLTASDGDVLDEYGGSVDISGETIVVGSILDSNAGGAFAGSAYVYVRSGTSWFEQQKLVAPDPAPRDQFGNVVAIRGDQIAICKPYDDEAAVDAGAVYVYSRSGTTWSQEKKLTASDAAANDIFGVHVAISGNTIVVGAHLDDTSAGPDAGSAYVFECSITCPSITCPPNQSVPAASAAGAVVSYPLPTVGDNCPGVTIVCNPTSGSTFPIGTTTVTCRASNASGNQATCTFTVTVTRACSTVVTNTNDSGPGSLRAAIDCANANPGLDTISFNIPGVGSHTISPASALPTISDSIIIDGTTQPGFAGMPIIELDGTQAAPTVDGLKISGFNAANSLVRGLVINRFNGSGIEIRSSRNCKIEGNFIGTDLSGTIALGNAQAGPDGGVALFDSDHCVIGGVTPAARNIISGNSVYAVAIQHVSNDNIVQGNYIGTDVTGNRALGSAGNGFLQAGVLIQDSSNNLIGGTTVAARNVIAGNSFGLNIYNTSLPATGNLVQGNFIGTDKEGVRGLGNLVGVDVSDVSGNTIGGTIAGARNIISANDLVGISLRGATGTLVQGNYIGTDVTGTRKAGNGSSFPPTLGLGGVVISGAFNNIIGGNTPEARNVISGNDTDGIQIFGQSTTGNRVEGNFIGTDKDGLAALGNARHGVFITDINGSPSNNTIGGTSQGVGNMIAFNGGDGVAVGSGNSAPIRGHAILGNSIFANAGLGIDLGSDGVTLNDPIDNDSGPNHLQNFPILISATSSADNTTIVGSLNSTPNTSFRVEFFANDACDPSGFGEGQQPIGAWTVATDASGNENFRITFSDTLDAGQFVTATATDPNGNTSEFSQCAQVQEGLTISCPFDISVDTRPGEESAVVNYPPPALGGPAETVICSPPSGSIFPIGATTVTCTATDAASNQTTCTFVINVSEGCSTVVTNTNDSGPGSLRAAIDCANAHPGLDTISFNIPGAAPHSIHLLSPLPQIGDAVAIDGTTQPGFVGMPIIELDGSAAGAFAIGLAIDAPNCVVRGLVINRFSGQGGFGIRLEFADHCQVEGNFIGTDLTGTVALGNDIGVVLGGSHNCTIGGTTPAARNLISGNAFSGVSFLLNSDSNVVQGNFIGTEITGTLVLINLPGFPGSTFYPAGIVLQDSHHNIVGGTTVEARNVISGNHVGIVILNGPVNTPADGNVIQGNFIGTDKDGMGAVPNETGVRLAYQSGINTIGGTLAGARNIISGNEQVGISLDLDGGPGPLVQGNYIGTDVTGTRKLANGNGITIPGMNATVGGDTPEERNLISGNAGDGIQILGPGSATGNRVAGNLIGTDKDGLAALGNGRHGVLLSGNAAYNSIGGLTHTTGNTIAFNGGDGVSVTVSGIPALFPDYNPILGNSIFANGGVGIDLGSDGVTPNDVGDGDNGPNFLQNFPILISVTSGGGNTTIRGSLNSNPSTRFQLEFFANDACDPSGFGEGQRLIGAWTVTTGPSGNENFRIPFPGTLSAGQFVTATATDQYDNTSEFSPCVPVSNPSSP